MKGGATPDWTARSTREWEFVDRDTYTWRSNWVRCILRGKEQFELFINNDHVATLPDWNSVLATTPMLLGIHGEKYDSVHEDETAP
jgi:hypothetical protein